MKAARYYGPGDVRVEQIPEPVTKDGQVKVKIVWNGICGSDLHAYLAPVPKFPTTTEPNDLTGETLPITLGHEFSGTIVEIGNGVDEAQWKIGQNVVVEPLFSCHKDGSCIFCAAKSYNLCPSANFIGIGGWGGGLFEYVAVDTRYVHHLPAGISLEVGAMIEPLAVAYYAVKKSGFKEGQSALIVGAGPIGLFILKVLRSIDPLSTVLVSEPASLRRELALKHGATIAIDPLTPSESGSPSPATVPTAALKATNGIGVDVAFDAAGLQASVDAALMSLRPKGTFVNVAIWEFDPKVSMNLILIRELNVTGTLAYTGIHPELIAAIAAGKITGIEELITKKISIDDVVEKGILSLLNEKETQVKILVHP
ncbi:alcohol dehydrogenase GroES domain protein [Pholiota conissans]|uniref:Alcohol dehydrogenase GroES domain protein n=1 Tax=Pholiota conissans TaxID=109636 RepID=A0A9P5Z019_9AGAR|nr:alcohol dehydrogenase GroES domain protein [Pholiota conissans]